MKASVLFCVVLALTLLITCHAGKRSKNNKNKKLKPWQVRSMSADNVKEIRDVLEDHIASCLSEYDDIMKTRAALEASEEIMTTIRDLKKKSKQFRKQRPIQKPEDRDPCTQNLQIGFREIWNDTTGDMWYNMSILSNTSVRECNAAHTWLDLRDVTEGTGKNMTYGDYEHLLGLCPPKPECVPYVTRSWTADGNSFPMNGESLNITLLTNYVGPCVNESRYRLDMEVKSCPAVEEPDRVVFRLPHGCISRDICRDAMWSLRWESSSRPTEGGYSGASVGDSGSVLSGGSGATGGTK